MNQVERIEHMEAILDEATEVMNELSAILDKYEVIREKYRELIDYYSSDNWMRDFDADEAGNLPEDLKRGVLSEDAVYDLMTKNRILTIQMLEIITENLKRQ